MSNEIEIKLADFGPDAITVKLCQTMFGVLPFAPDFILYNNIEGAVQRVAPGAGEDVIAKAKQLAEGEDVKQAMWIANALDTSDKLIAGFAGAKNLLSLFGGGGGSKKRTFESDPEQAADAALKGAGLGYMIYKLYPGEIGEKVNLFRETPAGVETAVYYVTADIALPFTDNLVEAGGGLVQKLFNSKGDAVSSKFSAIAGSEAFGQAKNVMTQMTGPLESYIEQAKGYTGPLMEKIKGVLPSAGGIANAADSGSGIVATGLDLLPVYTLLCARMAAEACALRAHKGL